MSQDEQAKVGRDAFLARSGKFREATVTVEALGDVLVREISGTARAKLLATQANASRAGAGLDIEAYQRALLLAGLADPDSPEGARTPLLQKGDLDAAMELGAGVIDALVTRIEELSGLLVDAEAVAYATFRDEPGEAPVLPASP